jgi:G protein-coupled receptor 158
VRDRDLLKYLLGIALIVIGYMSAWTAVNMDHVRENVSLLDEGATPDKTKYVICKSHWWDYVIEIGKLKFYFTRCTHWANGEVAEIPGCCG